MSRTQWMSRAVTDTLGTAGSIVLSDESTARDEPEDWLHDHYDIEAECLSEHLCAPVLTAARPAMRRWPGLGGSEGWIWDEADVKDAAECLRAVAHSN